MRMAFLLIIALLFYQQYPKDIYMESWKKGKAKVTESKVIIDVDNNSTSFSADIKNESGKVKYRLIGTPTYNRLNLIASYIIELRLNGTFNKNNLLCYYSSDDRYILNGDDGSPIYNINILSPNEDANGKRVEVTLFPLLTKRVIKVENFYCIIQVQKVEYDDSNRDTIKSMQIEVDLANYYDGPRTSSSSWYVLN